MISFEIKWKTLVRIRGYFFFAGIYIDTHTHNLVLSAVFYVRKWVKSKHYRERTIYINLTARIYSVEKHYLNSASSSLSRLSFEDILEQMSIKVTWIFFFCFGTLNWVLACPLINRFIRSLIFLETLFLFGTIADKPPSPSASWLVLLRKLPLG